MSLAEDIRLPHSPEAEEGVLGAVLKSPRSIDLVAPYLEPDDFHFVHHRHVWRAMLSLWGADQPIDYMTVCDRLRTLGTYEAAGGLMYLSGLSLATPTAAHIEHYARIVQRAATHRRLIAAAQHIAEVAYRGDLDAAAAVAQATELVGAVGERVTTGAAARFQGLTLDELEQRPGPAWLVDRLLPVDSVAVLEGVTDTYKTFLALAWAHCTALGMPWLGRPVASGRVLYLLGEGTRGLPRRAAAWQIVNLGDRRPVPDLAFVVDEMPQLANHENAQSVLAANPGPFALVVVDTLARAFVGLDENNQRDMGLLIEGADRIRRATGACVLLLHHLNAQGHSRGSTALPGGVNTRLRLEREGQTRVVKLTTGKQKDAEPDGPIMLVGRTVELGTTDSAGRQETSLVLELDDSDAAPAAKVDRLVPAAVRALEALAELGEARYESWRDATGQVKVTFHRSRNVLIERGFVEHTADVYRITDLGLEQVPFRSITVPFGTNGTTGDRGSVPFHTPIGVERMEPPPTNGRVAAHGDIHDFSR